MTDIPELQENNDLTDVPDGVRYILDTIRGAGYEAYIVGGCVRDILLGRIPDDWDITTSALPQQVKELFPATVDTGLQHGTVMVLKGRSGYEVTTYRIDGEYKDGRHPESVTFTPSLEEDLKRRDFTINAFAYNPDEGIIDLFDGIEDLKNGIIRAVGDPRKRFSEDALRIMRAVRFSAQLSFDIEENTEAAISEFAERLGQVSRERIRVEFEKTLYSDNPGYVNRYAELGLAPYIVPEVYERTFTSGSAEICSRLKTMDADQKTGRLAAFFEGLSWEEVRSVMRTMTFDNRARDLVSGIIRYSSQVLEGAGLEGRTEADVKVRSDLRAAGPEVYRLCLDHLEASGHSVQSLRDSFAGILERGDAYETGMLAVDGNDLINAGVPAGRQVGEVLGRLLDRVIEDPGMNRKELLTEQAAVLINKNFNN